MLIAQRFEAFDVFPFIGHESGETKKIHYFQGSFSSSFELRQFCEFQNNSIFCDFRQKASIRPFGQFFQKNLERSPLNQYASLSPFVQSNLKLTFSSIYKFHPKDHPFSVYQFRTKSRSRKFYLFHPLRSSELSNRLIPLSHSVQSRHLSF